MARQTIKSFVYNDFKNGMTADWSWKEARREFPNRLVTRGYVLGLYKRFAEGEKIADAFAKLMSESRQRP